MASSNTNDQNKVLKCAPLRMGWPVSRRKLKIGTLFCRSRDRLSPVETTSSGLWMPVLTLATTPHNIENLKITVREPSIGRFGGKAVDRQMSLGVLEKLIEADRPTWFACSPNVVNPIESKLHETKTLKNTLLFNWVICHL